MCSSDLQVVDIVGEVVAPAGTNPVAIAVTPCVHDKHMELDRKSVV